MSLYLSCRIALSRSILFYEIVIERKNWTGLLVSLSLGNHLSDLRAMFQDKILKVILFPRHSISPTLCYVYESRR